ncbi:hypothetical protein C900_01533 [Fulvivirga imtechensis AK7]|uniref:Uncharacterized protein n=1 Tax=Fulvivirga imtechensis AK7 TaxID=1237149 RepID=L8JUJ2_9BACT|nr:hypothetical protein C900_01533 [Fulvivirga imtechensis AK7]
MCETTCQNKTYEQNKDRPERELLLRPVQVKAEDEWYHEIGQPNQDIGGNI